MTTVVIPVEFCLATVLLSLIMIGLFLIARAWSQRKSKFDPEHITRGWLTSLLDD